MSAKTKTTDSIKDWQSLHQQWWSSMLDSARKQAASAGWDASSFKPGDSLKGFGDVFGKSLGSENEATVERFLAGSKQFLQWVEGLSAQVAARGGIPGKIEDWTALFKQSAGPMLESNNPFLHLFQGLSGDGARGLEQMFAGLPNVADAFKGELKGMLGTPAFGFMREQQERAQQLIAAQLEQQEAMNAYNAQMLRASKLSFEKLELKLADREEPGRQLDSLRAVYDLWIDAAEEAYAEIALSAEFRAAYGDLVNKQMRVRQMLQAEVERQTGQVGMPTRSELNSVHKRLQEMRRRIRELEDRLEQATPGPTPRAAPVAAPASKPAARSKPKPKAKAAVKPARAAPKRAKPGAARSATTRKAATKPARAGKRKSAGSKAAGNRRNLNRLA